jgi:hypothetical protein
MTYSPTPDHNTPLYFLRSKIRKSSPERKKERKKEKYFPYLVTTIP